MSKDGKDVLVIPDCQIPYHDPRSIKAVEGVMKDFHWDRGVILGDFMDFNCISSHNERNLRAVEGTTIEADYEIGNKILDRWQKYIPNWDYIEGNHEDRMTRYIDANPRLEGSIEVPKGLRLKERGINWVPYWSDGKPLKIGNAYFIHGKYTSEHHAKKHVSRYGVNVFYGHLHDTQCYPLVLHGEDKTIVGQSLGCLCSYDQPYMKGSPSNWQQSFGAFHFFDDGFFSYEVVRIFKNRFYFRGKVYQG